MRTTAITLLLAAATAATACSSSPVAPAGTATVAASTLSSPANGATIANLSQPVTLTIANGYVSSGSPTYTFEVASDSAFNTKVVSQDVAQGSGSTSLKLGTLPAGADYYWRVKATASGTTSGYSATSKFTIGAALVIQAPTPVSPLTGATGLAQKPTFTITNATRTGPATAISYRFDVSTVSSFATVTQTATVAETTTRTSWTPTTALAGGTTYYWRAQAVDSTGVTSAYTATQSVVTQVVIDLTKVNYQRFVNISAWPITATIRAVEQDGNSPGPMCIDYDKRDSWPTSDFFGDPAVQVQANQWYFANIGGQWYGGSGENMRPNQICKQGQMTEAIGPDGTWGGPMDSWAPGPGELVGYMMTTPARFWPAMKTLDERSQMVVQPWIDTRFNSAATLIKK